MCVRFMDMDFMEIYIIRGRKYHPRGVSDVLSEFVYMCTGITRALRVFDRPMCK
jgi:hypothetical protein